MIELTDLTPAAEDGWHTLFALSESDADNWVLIGGQMMAAFAAAYAMPMARVTADVDVVVDVRARPDATRWLARWLVDQVFELDGVSPEGIGHRFVRSAAVGQVIFDVLGPEGLRGVRGLGTMANARTVAAPGGNQALHRSRLLDIAVSGIIERVRTVGRVRLPSLLGALIVKAAATTLAARRDPERDWQDAAQLLAMIPDPIELAAECDRKDRQRLRVLRALDDRRHCGWDARTDDEYRRGVAALAFLLTPG